jgi:coenzyme PQQ precursor peptide PqqA
MENRVYSGDNIFVALIAEMDKAGRTPHITCCRWPVCDAGCEIWKETKMAWKTPKFVEVSVGMEINMYACASRK